MTSISARLGLVVPSEADQFSTDDIAANWGKIDAAPGIHICISTNRPAAWTAAQDGRLIYETNTGLLWRWNGSTFDRLNGTGMLRRNDGSPAIGERTTDFSTSSTTFVKAVGLTNVVVPAGTRPLQVVVTFQQGVNTSKNFRGSVFRSNTNNSGPQLDNNVISGADDSGQGGTFVSVIRDGLAAGTYDFSFQIKSGSTGGGTSTLKADAGNPITIFVVEL